MDITSIISEFNTAGANFRVCTNDYAVSKALAKDGRDGDDLKKRIEESDAVFDAQDLLSKASIRATRAHCALLNALEDRTIDAEDRMQLFNAVVGVPKTIDIRCDSAELAEMAVRHG
jgi:hypothetical protein